MLAGRRSPYAQLSMLRGLGDTDPASAITGDDPNDSSDDGSNTGTDAAGITFVLGPSTNPSATYNCTSSVCYAISSAGADVNEAFVAFQQALNAVGGSAGFAAIAADGLIGAATLAAYNKALTWISAQTGVATSPFSSVAQLAPNVTTYTQALTYAAQQYGTKPATKTATSAVKGGVVPASDLKAYKAAAPSSSTPYWIAGGLAALAALWFAKEEISGWKKMPSTAMAGARRRRRR